MSVCNFCPLYKGAHSGCLQHDNPHFHHNLRLAALFAAEQEYFKTLAPGRLLQQHISGIHLILYQSETLSLYTF